MIYFGGILAENVGRQRWNMPMAPRRARLTASASDGGRIGSSSAALCSFSKISAATRKNASARFLGAVARKLSTNTRMRTSSALASGISCGVEPADSNFDNATAPDRPDDIGCIEAVKKQEIPSNRPFPVANHQGLA